MTLAINNEQDIYKFALSLYDKLVQTGNSELANTLAEITDNCFSSSDQALSAHREAFIKIKETADNLPIEYLNALDRAIEL